MADKMISVSEDDAQLIHEIQEHLQFPVTIKAVVHTAIVKLYKETVPNKAE